MIAGFEENLFYSNKKEDIKFYFYIFLKTYSFAYSALTAIPANPVQSVSVTTDINNFTFRKLGVFFIDISPVIVIKLITLNKIANRNMNVASGIDGAVVALAIAQYTKIFIYINYIKNIQKNQYFFVSNSKETPYCAEGLFINRHANVSYMLEKTL